MAIMTDKSAKKSGKAVSHDEISDLLRNFYQPNEASIQNFDDFYSQLRYKIDGAKTEVAEKTNNKRSQIEDDYERRERELKKMLVEMDTRDKTIAKRKVARVMRLVAAVLLSSLIVVAGVWGYQYLHKSQLGQEPKMEKSAEIIQIETEWQAYKLKQLALIEETKLKFNAEMQKEKPDAQLIANYERQMLEAKAQLSQAKTQMLLAKKAVAV